MGKKRSSPVSGFFWNDGDVEVLDSFQKLLFLQLMTNGDCPPSGVYRFSCREIAAATGIPQPLVEHYLRVHLLKDDELRAEVDRFADELFKSAKQNRPIENAMVDANNRTVFVVNKLKYNLGGRPDLIAASIIGDYYLTFRSRPLWDRFRDVYQNLIAMRPALTEHFTKVDTDQSGEGFAIPAHFFEKKTPSPFPDNLAESIQTYLNRYSAELPEEDSRRVFEVYDAISTNLRTGKPLSEKKRFQFLLRMDKEPAPLIARACYMFKQKGGIQERSRFNFLLDIINGEAQSWYKAWIHELKQRREKT